ncbi:MAG: hypothetical protein AWU58_1109 [Methanohalophilus sp. T328-1]|jgi:hypothetical protein|nr:MAG: hypothetical protein AWU58_1109 [Methanohalophilus sp. T328-1]
MQNLDYLCMKYGQNILESANIKKDDENVITKALGVLQENGPYALFLYLEEKKKKDSDIASNIYSSFIKLIKEDELKPFMAPPQGDKSIKELTDWLIEISKDIDKLFLFKKIMEQTLLYARYYAKALPESGDKS